MGGFDLYPTHSSSHIQKHPEPSFWATIVHVRGWETVVGTGEAAAKHVHWAQRLLTAGLERARLVPRVPQHPLPLWALALRLSGFLVPSQSTEQSENPFSPA